MGNMEDVPCHIAVFHHGVWRGHDSPAITKQFYHFAKLYATNTMLRESKINTSLHVKVQTVKVEKYNKNTMIDLDQ